MGDQVSAIAHLRDGTWRERQLDWIRAIAIVSLLLDGVTAVMILRHEEYIVFNPVISGLWEVHPAVGVSYLIGLYGLFAFICTRRLGWFATAFSVYRIVLMGVFGGLNNIELLWLGPPSLADVLVAKLGIPGPSLSAYLLPFVAGLAGIVVALYRHDWLPWGEVVVLTVGTSCLFYFSTELTLYVFGLLGV